MIDTDFFNKYQKSIVKIANTRIGRNLIGIKDSCPDDAKIIEVRPDSYTWYKGQKKMLYSEYLNLCLAQKIGNPKWIMNELKKKDKYILVDIYRTSFRTHNKFAKNIERVLDILPIKASRNTYNNDWYLYPALGLSTQSYTFNPNADPETSSVDGATYYFSTQVSWASIVVVAGNGSASTSTFDAGYKARSGTSADTWDFLVRGVFQFSTVTLDNYRPVESGEVSLYGQEKLNGNSWSDAHASLALIDLIGSPNTTSVTTQDFARLHTGGNTRMASDFSYASFSTAQYNVFTLNNDGINFISRTANTKFGTCAAADLDATQPNYGGSNIFTQLIVYHAEDTDGNRDPKLDVDTISPFSPMPSAFRNTSAS